MESLCFRGGDGSSPSDSSDPGREAGLSVPYTAVLSALYALRSGPFRSKKSLVELSIPGKTMSDFMNYFPLAYH